MTARTYGTPESFKMALEQRLRASSTTGLDFTRRRQLLVFDRFLARVTAVMGNAAILKGGLVIEFRIERARTTKDIDLRLDGSPGDVLDRLREAGRLDLGDFMRYEANLDRDHPDIRNEGMRYNGLRHRVEAKLAGKVFGQPFGVDVAFGDPILGEPDIVVAGDTLGFAGIEPPTLRLYPIESQIAEKLHAYTMPRERQNSRVKDLPDLALLATVREIDGAKLRLALERTFDYRDTHALPASIPEPPASWAAVYERMVGEDDLRWRTLPDLLAAVRAFLDPVLANAPAGQWTPPLWGWHSA
jgi:hypothetical protein